MTQDVQERLAPPLRRACRLSGARVRALHDPEAMSWPPRRILVGTDFSDSAEAAFRAGAALARRVGAKLDLLHVLPDRPESVIGYEPLDALLFRDAPDGGAAALSRLEALARRVAPELTQAHVVEGEPVAELVALRDRLDVDLVALGAGCMRSMRRFILGSVAGKMLGHPGCPLLLVAEAPAAGEFKKILIAQENPRVASPWLEIGLSLAHVERSEISLLHVLPPRGYLSDSHHIELEPQRAPARLSALLARLDPTVPAQVIVRSGEAGQEIASAARELGVHLLVLGAERNRIDGSPGPVVNRIARSGPPAFLVIWPERESDEDY
jgi:nucleotide-binding universal stress UspA family protein